MSQAAAVTPPRRSVPALAEHLRRYTAREFMGSGQGP
jgi:hypothetical protein